MAGGYLKNKMDYGAMETAINDFQIATENVRSTLNKLDGIVNDTINSGEGILDGQRASRCQEQWQNFASEFKSVIKICAAQGENARVALTELQSVDK